MRPHPFQEIIAFSNQQNQMGTTKEQEVIMLTVKAQTCHLTRPIFPKLGYFSLLILLLWSQQLKSQVDDYFPLQLGNTWTYDEIVDTSLYGQQTVTIIDTFYQDGKNYYLFDKFFYVREFLDSSLFYIDGQKVFRNVDGVEQLWFDFGAQVDSSWLITVYDSVLHTNVQVKVTLSGKNYNRLFNGRYFKNCYGFYFENLYATDLDWTYTFAPGIGCVENGIGTLVPAYFQFRYGTVNNVEYPDLIVLVPDETKKSENMPETSRILPVYPNPFNSSLNIQLFINNPKNEKAYINIYNTVGQIVKSLPINQSFEGNYTLKWQAENYKGENVSSGLYILILRIGDQSVSTQKAMYLR